MKKVCALVYYQHGPPLDVVRVEEQSLPELQPDYAFVQMQAAPVNPVDLNVIEGKYPLRPELPAVPGVEGAGVVVEVGENVRELKRGSQVLLPHSVGTWREACVVKARDVFALPAELDPEQAAMLKINPATAWRMMHDFVPLKDGDWLIQNAANSGVGRAVIQLAHILNWRTVNVVRRPELIDELKSEGGDVVLCDSDDLPSEVKKATSGAKIQLALNAVGGESALHIANALATEGTIVTYGAMGRQPLRIPNGLLIFKNLHWCGFWITKWYRDASSEQARDMLQQLCDLAQRGILKSKVERTYPLDQAQEALQRAQENRREGKILLRMNQTFS